MGVYSKFRTLFRIWDTKRVIRNLRFFIENDITTAHALVKDEAIEDCVFELEEMKEFLLPCVPKIFNVPDSLALLERQPKSFARFGDGEIALMKGNDISFQKYDPVLAEKMLKVLKTKRDDLYVGLLGSFFNAIHPSATEVERIVHRKFYSDLRRFCMREANPEIKYLDAACLMGYFGRHDWDTYHEIERRKMKIFEGRKVAIVTGKSVLEKLDYDIFELAAGKIVIDAPSKNAFSEYDNILRDISRNVSKDTMICLMLGPTATVMAADLADMGYLAWDSGHMMKDYDIHMKKLEKTAQTQADFFAPD